MDNNTVSSQHGNRAASLVALSNLSLLFLLRRAAARLDYTYLSSCGTQERELLLTHYWLSSYVLLIDRARPLGGSACTYSDWDDIDQPDASCHRL